MKAPSPSKTGTNFLCIMQEGFKHFPQSIRPSLSSTNDEPSKVDVSHDF